jgi:ammonia channel protein AmtB
MRGQPPTQARPEAGIGSSLRGRAWSTLRPVIKELAAGVGCAAYSFVVTYAMLRVINAITPVHVGRDDERGLDAAELGEAAYTFDPPAQAAGPSAAPASG